MYVKRQIRIHQQSDGGTHLDVFLLPVVFDQPPNDAAFRMPKDQSTTGIFLNRKQIQCLANGAMIPSFGFFLLQKEGFQLILGLPRRRVDALQTPITPITSHHSYSKRESTNILVASALSHLLANRHQQWTAIAGLQRALFPSIRHADPHIDPTTCHRCDRS